MNVKKIVYSGVFISLGVIVPQIFHLIGGPALGGIFLPMHFPVLMAGLLCGPFVGAVAGIFSPLLSSAITGMPPAPILWFMMVELFVYGTISGLLYYKMKKNMVLSLVSAMVAGRLAYGFVLFIVVNLFGIGLPLGLGVLASVVKGFPGILLQLIVISILIRILERSSFKNEGIDNRKGSPKIQ